MAFLNKQVVDGITTWGVLTDGYSLEQRVYVYKTTQVVKLHVPAFVNHDLGFRIYRVNADATETEIFENDAFFVTPEDTDDDAMSECYTDDVSNFNNVIDHRLIKSVTIHNADGIKRQFVLRYRTYCRVTDVLRTRASDVFDGYQTYGVDRTGQDPHNYKEDELHYVNLPSGKQVMLPLGGPFYKHDVVVKKNDGTVLTEGVEYIIGGMDPAKTEMTYHNSGVYTFIYLLDAGELASYVGNIKLTYRAYGGEVNRDDFERLKGVVYGLIDLWHSIDIAGLAAHIEDETDPHVMYQKESEKNLPNGYAGLDENGIIPDELLNVLHGNAANYIIAELGDDPVANAALVRARYAAACALTPNGAALATDNRATLIITTGVCDFEDGNASDHGLVLDTSCVDILAFGDVVLTSAITTASRGTVEQQADDVHITSVSNNSLTIELTATLGTAYPYHTASDLNKVVLDGIRFNCPDTDRYAISELCVYSGKYRNCIANGILFYGTIEGQVEDCSGSSLSFKTIAASGLIRRCVTPLGVENCYGAVVDCSLAVMQCIELSGVLHNCTIGALGADGVPGEITGSATVTNNTFSTINEMTISSDATIRGNYLNKVWWEHNNHQPLNTRSSNYIICVLGDDAIANAALLKEKYVEACALTPNGTALAADNRATLMITTGICDFEDGGGTHGFVLDTEFVDIFAIGDVTLTSETTTGYGTVEQTADDVNIQATGYRKLIIDHTVDSVDTGVAYKSFSTATTLTNVELTATRSGHVLAVDNPMSLPTFVDCYFGNDIGLSYNTAPTGSFIRCTFANGLTLELCKTITMRECTVYGDFFSSGSAPDYRLAADIKRCTFLSEFYVFHTDTGMEIIDCDIVGPVTIGAFSVPGVIINNRFGSVSTTAILGCVVQGNTVAGEWWEYNQPIIHPKQTVTVDSATNELDHLSTIPYRKVYDLSADLAGNVTTINLVDEDLNQLPDGWEVIFLKNKAQMTLHLAPHADDTIGMGTAGGTVIAPDLTNGGTVEGEPFACIHLRYHATSQRWFVIGADGTWEFN